MKKKFENITLIAVDCVELSRVEKALDVCLRYFDFAEVKVLSSLDYKFQNPKIKLEKIKPLCSLAEYSDFMIRDLTDRFETDFVLVAQYDGFILNPEAWTDEFLDYDYIGAPWWYEDDCNVGNGGFSLRSKKLQKILATDPIIFETHCEDHNICRTYGNYLKSKGICFAPEDLAKKFSLEGNMHGKIPGGKRFGDIWNGELGFHGLHKTDLKNWEGYADFFADHGGRQFAE